MDFNFTGRFIQCHFYPQITLVDWKTSIVFNVTSDFESKQAYVEENDQKFEDLEYETIQELLYLAAVI